MQALLIEGGHPLRGEVPVHGSKNGCLPLLAAALLAPGQTVLHRCPRLTDVDTTLAILRALGARWTRTGETLRVDATQVTATDIPPALMQRQRASVLFLGALIGRYGEATLSLPGGCALGARPIDLHLSVLRQMGGRAETAGELVQCEAPRRADGRRRLPGGEVQLPLPSVGATENFLLLAAGAEGPSRLRGAAREPEIAALAALLTAMGAEVQGAGTEEITCRPARRLHPAEQTVIADRIEAATLLCAAVSTGGAVTLTGVSPELLGPVLEVLWQTGCALRCGTDWVSLQAPSRPRPPEPVVTAPWPGVPTDVQAPLMAALLRCRGQALLRETVFPSRFHQVPELRRLGAQIETRGEWATVTGVDRLQGARLQGRELRGTAALVCAALAAEGQSLVTGLEYLDRGYEDTKNLLSSLGAGIKQVEISA